MVRYFNWTRNSSVVESKLKKSTMKEPPTHLFIKKQTISFIWLAPMLLRRKDIRESIDVLQLMEEQRKKKKSFEFWVNFPNWNCLRLGGHPFSRKRREKIKKANLSLETILDSIWKRVEHIFSIKKVISHQIVRSEVTRRTIKSEVNLSILSFYLFSNSPCSGLWNK